jgi:hypothetical protein
MKKAILSIFLAMIVTISFNLASCTPEKDSTQVTLSVEEHPLKGAPQIEPLVITPLDGSQEEMLKVHAADRSLSFQDQSTTIDGNFAFTGTLDGKPLVAEQTFINNSSDSYVWVTLDGNEIYRISTGPASPITTLRGLWIYDSHWALETVLINLEGDNIVTPFALGQITIDDVLQNETKGYDDAFGLQIIAGKLFFFFKKDGKIGYFYNGQETMLGYEEIPHYNCCSDSALNPIQAQNMVAFFARTGDAWYYVEMGIFSK